MNVLLLKLFLNPFASKSLYKTFGKSFIKTASLKTLRKRKGFYMPMIRYYNRKMPTTDITYEALSLLPSCWRHQVRVYSEEVSKQ